MRILIGAPVRQSAEVFKLYLESLNQLERGGHTIDYFFILHNSPELTTYLEPHQYQQCKSDDEYKKDDTHHWTTDNLSAVAQMKNRLLQKAKAYDFFFLVDSDILLDPKTLVHLINQRKSIIAEVFWTKWKPDEREMPNAWMVDYYTFDTYDRLDEWRKPGLYRVGMSGACILIDKSAIDKGINYTPIYNVSCTIWEDRAFCIRAAVQGLPIYLDTHYPARHLYRREDVDEVLREKSINLQQQTNTNRRGD
jgi:hypothetical protein